MSDLKSQSLPVVHVEGYTRKGIDVAISVVQKKNGMFRGRFQILDGEKEGFLMRCYSSKDTVKKAVNLAKRVCRQYIDDEMEDDG